MNLKNKTMILTGAGSGVGRHLAQVFDEKGINLLLLDISESGLNETFNSLKQPDKHIAHRMDIRDIVEWKYLLGKAMLKWPSIDYLLNVAGYLYPGFIYELPIEEIDKHIDINIKGVIYGTRLVAEVMAAQGNGHIVNIASLAGISPVPGLNLYSATKFAVRGFSLSIAEELVSKGVHVTVICPDAIKTPMLDIQADKKEASLTFSGGRVLEVEDISKTLLEYVFPKKPREVTLPGSRGLLAGFANLFPDLSAKLFPFFQDKGESNQEKYRKQDGSQNG
jgi:3-oxoacyl-[acyl-carrier protein] reductase